MIIKWVKLGLSHLIEYPYINITWTGHVNPNWHPYYIPSHKKAFGLWESIISMYLANLSHQIIYLKFQKPFFFFVKLKIHGGKWWLLCATWITIYLISYPISYLMIRLCFFFFFWLIWFVYVWGSFYCTPSFFWGTVPTLIWTFHITSL